MSIVLDKNGLIEVHDGEPIIDIIYQQIDQKGDIKNWTRYERRPGGNGKAISRYWITGNAERLDSAAEVVQWVHTH